MTERLNTKPTFKYVVDSYLKGGVPLLSAVVCLNTTDLYARYEVEATDRKAKSLKDFKMDKLLQIYDLKHALISEAVSQPTSVTELCCGKGYAGILVAKHFSVDFLGYDYNEEVLSQTSKIARTLGYAGATITEQRDLLKEPVPFRDGGLTLALHACGKLTPTIIKAFAESRTKGTLAITPCCYNKIPTEDHEWLSDHYKSSGLRLSQNLLKAILSVPTGSTAHKTIIIKHHMRMIKILANIVLNQAYKRGEYIDTTREDSSGYIPIRDTLLSVTFTNMLDYAYHLKYLLPAMGYNGHVVVTQAMVNFARTVLDLISDYELLTLRQYIRLYELFIMDDYVTYLRDNGCEAKMFAFTSTSLRNICILASRTV